MSYYLFLNRIYIKGMKTTTGCRATCSIPLLENGFVLFLPEVLEVRRELVPDAEERVGGDLLFA